MTDESERNRAITKFKNSPWVPKLRELYNYLELSEERVELLRKIDLSMTEGTEIVDFLKDHLKGLAFLTEATDAHFYIDDGKISYLIASSNDIPMPESIDHSAFDQILKFDDKEPVFLRKSDLEELGLTGFLDQSGYLFLPVWLPKSRATNGNAHEWPPHDRRFGWTVIRDSIALLRVTTLTDPDVQKYAASVLTQLAIGTRVRFDRKQSEWFERITNDFFEKQLDPDDCFDKLVQRIPQYLPDFGVYKLTVKPEVSILIEMREKDTDTYLLMVANTTGEKNIGVKLKLRESVVGLLFEQTDRSLVLGNPQIDPELKTRYKAYSGKNNRSELVMPIEDSQGRRIAAINLETSIANAYKGLHVAALRHLCLVVAQMVRALSDRIKERREQQQALIDAERPFWSSSGKMLLHDTKAPMTAIRMGVDNALKSGKLQKYDKIPSSLEPVQDNLDTLRQRIDEFSQEIYEFNVFRDYSIREIIAKAMKTINIEADRAKVIVDLLPSEDENEDFNVFCSLALKMHIYNIINNSIYWIGKRKKEEPKLMGRISIKVEKGPEPSENEEKDLNRTCVITFQDNGKGAPPDVVDKLFNRGVESRRLDEAGMGYALSAIGDYIRLLGTTVKAESEEGKYFRVIMTLPIFNPRIHKVGKI